MLLSVWTALEDRVELKIGGVDLLRNSSVLRPLLIAAILFGLSGNFRLLKKGLAIAAVAVILPVGAYVATFHRLSTEPHPLRALRDCALDTRGARPETHAYLSSYYQLFDHSPFYYLRQVGPWIDHGGRPSNDELDVRLYSAGQQAFAIMTGPDYRIFEEQLIRRELPLPNGLSRGYDIVVLSPGPLEACLRAAVLAGGKSLYGL